MFFTWPSVQLVCRCICLCSLHTNQIKCARCFCFFFFFSSLHVFVLLLKWTRCMLEWLFKGPWELQTPRRENSFILWMWLWEYECEYIQVLTVFVASSRSEQEQRISPFANPNKAWVHLAKVLITQREEKRRKTEKGCWWWWRDGRQEEQRRRRGRKRRVSWRWSHWDRQRDAWGGRSKRRGTTCYKRNRRKREREKKGGDSRRVGFVLLFFSFYGRLSLAPSCQWNLKNGQGYKGWKQQMVE